MHTAEVGAVDVSARPTPERKSWKLKAAPPPVPQASSLGGSVTVPLKCYSSGPGSWLGKPSHILLGTGDLPAALLGGRHAKGSCPPPKASPGNTTQATQYPCYS